MAVVLSDAALALEVYSVVAEIEQLDFYPELWKQVKHEKPLWMCNRTELLEPFSKFLAMLPTFAAHRYPFFLICSLAERKC